ncbi:MAG: hypothetical protein ABIT09_03415 [Croceibacterium sp.]
MAAWIRKTLYSPVAFDALFALGGTLAFAGMVLDMRHAYPAIESATQPLAKGGSLIAVLLAATLLAVASTRFDQKMADDFLFHTLTKSAFVAMFIVLFTAVGWHILLEQKFGMFSSNVAIAILAAAWAVSWFYTRVRGTLA